MTKYQYMRQKKTKQKHITKRAANAFFANLVIACVIMLGFFVYLFITNAFDKPDDLEGVAVMPPNTIAPEITTAPEIKVDHDEWFEDISATEREEEIEETLPSDIQNPGIYDIVNIIGYEDSYLLAKIAMAEAESCDTHVKALVMFVVLNRMKSDEFPDTIREVIFQEYNGVYQFTPIGNGRWDSVEPDDDCWAALELVVSSGYDFSDGALYFESCENPDNWHSRNLEFICEYEGVRFYR